MLSLNRSVVILLAAGASSRTETPKGIIPVRGIPWIVRQIEALCDIAPWKIRVVLGVHERAYRETIVEHSLDGAVKLIVNAFPERGVFSSVQTGIRATGKATAAFVLPLDTPVADQSVWQSLADSLATGVLAVTPTYDGRGGHPTLLAPAFVQTLLSLDSSAPTARLDRQMSRLSSVERIRVSTQDPKVSMNLNYADDYVEFERTLLPQAETPRPERKHPDP